MDPVFIPADTSDKTAILLEAKEKLKVFAYLKWEDHPVSFHFRLHPEEGRSFFSFCLMQ